MPGCAPPIAAAGPAPKESAPASEPEGETPATPDDENPTTPDCAAKKAAFDALAADFQKELTSKGIPGGGFAVVCSGKQIFAT